MRPALTLVAAAICVPIAALAQAADVLEEANSCTRAAALLRAVNTNEEIPDIFFNAVNECSREWDRVEQDYLAENPSASQTLALKYVGQVRDILRKSVVTERARVRAGRPR